MTPSTLARLAVAGSRTDLLRTVLTGLSALLATAAMLCAATVLSIHGWADRYTNPLLIEPGLRPGVAATLILVSFPVLALAGQCIRLGAPARDRRLSAIRLAGATPRQSVLIAIAETAVASLLGSVTALAAYLIGRHVLDRRDFDGRRVLPADVLPPAPVLVVLVLLVPVLAAIIGAVLMRQVIVTPLGVVRRVRTRGPRPWPGLLIVAGLVLFGIPGQLAEHLTWSKNTIYLFLGSGVVLTMAGVVLGTAWLSHTAGRLLRRYGRGPATMLAGQRLITDPWNGSRTMAALLTAVMAGAVALAYRELLATEFRSFDIFNAMMNPTDGGIGAPDDPEFYYGAVRLVMVAVALASVVAAAGVLVALAESIVARRRTYAALTATGVPRRTLAAAVAWQTLTPIVPALLLALAAGDALVRLIESEIPVGYEFRDCVAAGYPDCVAPLHPEMAQVLHVPIPWASLSLLGGGALLAVLVAVGAGLVVLRASTDLEELRAG
ncbi:FtsX-like permease family protein [Actinoplanes sp. NPDC026619]|uniref:FtsX-like permease family protein n=1 Tax=Actinoplanes sp. NPDC026619 TaxID=3155798 RepID=UPI0033CDA838